MIPFNRPILPERASELMTEAFRSGKVSGDGAFSRRCEAFLKERYGASRCLMTTSCTDALELAAILSGVGPGDEVILPSFTFVSTANAFALRGAKLVFADSLPDQPNLDPAQVEALLSPRTKVIVPVHYAGVAVDMDPIMSLAARQGAFVVEDAAQAIEATYKGRQLGLIGDLGAFSFHETKNIHCGEGGLIALRDPAFVSRAEVIREKGTNRSAFFRGEVDKYGWVDIGSSFLPSDILSAILWAQIEHLEAICQHRMALWHCYREALDPLERSGWAHLPVVPDYAGHNAHAFYLILPDESTRAHLIAHLKAREIMAVFHYQSLHRSPYFQDKHDGRSLPNSDRYSDCLLRLPLFHDLTEAEQGRVVDGVLDFFRK
ncbi:dTDP-4-amino-4,6-dideoxygalactose transaminase [Geothrix campi]|uniref:dTDP-4-amino-4,6-dideoxygalactose transaminase n=1 Tax=Geothrix campi TaxID=2966450 RepID=UPI002148914E